MPEESTVSLADFGNNDLLKKRPLVISGPCSAETEEQVLQTASQIAQTGHADLLRAGIWKPRTKPGNFEGVGEIGLSWLQKARNQTGLPFIIEVATAKQAATALAYQADALWIGARTTVNPFSVQEIAEALKGFSGPVFVKNPTNPDIELWSGAVERLQKAGIFSIGLIHRGFSVYGQEGYRNEPMWSLAIEMKQRFPGLPMLCDPSHICGFREGIPEIAQTAIDFDYDGLMIETHIHPDLAWSDARQQVTPLAFAQIIQNLKWRKEDFPEEAFHQTLITLRHEIDQIDEQILQLLSQRMQVSEIIGSFKKENSITILQTKRWLEILDRALHRAGQLGLSKEFIGRYFNAVHMESIRHQKKVLDS